MSFASPGTLPHAQNMPQKAKYDLYTESVSDTEIRTAPLHYTDDVDS